MSIPNTVREGEFAIPDLSTLPPDGGPDFNRLIFTSSPYLLQHARNPVDWYPWGEEAFEKARRENKPVFLSIGYSTCHWCHVMEHESFEDETIAATLNAHYISIKVDREERPDIDQIYMTVCQAMTGAGGWPLTVFLTPEKKPFYSGTYFPKNDRYGRPGFLRVLTALRDTWTAERARVEAIGEDLQAQLSAAMVAPGGDLPDGIVERAVSILAREYDSAFGGFGAAPKFPMGHLLSFLLRRAVAAGDDALRAMVEQTLLRMYRGGIWDHLGGGFCRYSVDRRWLVPHFEKMLYDNALLLTAFVDAFRVSGNPLFRRVAEDIIAYLRRDMTDACGLFYSAENADSEGEEGRFYVFTKEEFVRVLGDDDAALVEYFGITDEGNFEHGKNILHIAVEAEAWMRQHHLSEDAASALLDSARARLFASRAARVHPSRDDKILASWNGLMISALAQAAAAFDDTAISVMACRAADALRARLRAADGRLLHRLRGEDADIPGFLDDYAFVIWGLIDLYQATFLTQYLREAVELTEAMLVLFRDETDAGLFFTASDAEPMIVRMKDAHDGALPSGNAAAAYNLVRLARLTGNSTYERHAENILSAFGAQVDRAPTGHTVLLAAHDLLQTPSVEIVLTGPSRDSVASFARAVRTRWLPHGVMLYRGTDDDQLAALAPFTAAYTTIDGEAAAYVCRGFQCELPVTTVDAMLALIEGH